MTILLHLAHLAHQVLVVQHQVLEVHLAHQRLVQHRLQVLEQSQQAQAHLASLHYKESNMRLFNFVAWTTIAIAVALVAQPAQAAGETKRVCRPDPKTKKEVCKNIKVHKKVEGTKVPEKAPAKKAAPQKKK